MGKDIENRIVDSLTKGLSVKDIIKEHEFLTKALKGFESVIYINNINSDGSIELIWANNRYLDLTGFTFEERYKMGERYYEMYYHPDDYKNAMQIIRDVANWKINSYAMNYRIKHKNGKWVWIYSKGNIFEENKKLGIRKCISIAINMTGRIVQNNEQLDILLKEIAQLKNRSLIDKLTKTEKQIVKYLVDCMTTHEIAKKRNRSYDTINNHRRNIFKKLNLHSIAGLVNFAVENGLMFIIIVSETFIITKVI